MREKENPRHHAPGLVPFAMIAFLGLTLAGCASTRMGGVNSASTDVRGDYQVEVTNRNWQDIHVYAVKGTATHPIGVVGGHESRTLRLPVAFVGRLGGLRLAARPAGRSDLHYTDVLDVAPGQQVGWSLEPNLKLSFSWVR